MLANVLKNIHQSILRHPRKIWIIFFTPDEFERLIQGEAWIEKTYEHFVSKETRYIIYCCHEILSETAD